MTVTCDMADLARFAAETAADAAPFEEIPKLDQVAVDQASGDDERANARLTNMVLLRSDDDLGPIDVPERSGQIIRPRGMDRQGQRAAH